MILRAGTTAPDFTLKKSPDETLTLSELRGRPVVLVFYPADWSPVCGDELALFNEVLPEFKRLDAQLVGFSVDGPWCHRAYAKARNLDFSLLADFEPKGAVARQYGAYRERDGFTERALFVIDAEGVIRWSYLSDVSVNPGAAGILSALEDLSRQSAPAGSAVGR
jgi:peroxiredoxin